ncbi:hypothetical protein CS535_12050 [Yersinia massiliensis]|uniref:Uncharacterized protein n=1 Tax=Yersinia massiliensis TaxID=419257 RepID=A0ABM6UNZ1_9GAMM|nr:hypothetical protein CRN74_16295 [Yersinia frederiksenii]AVX36696.1 hypothetical protein DA391_02865 [Yersinia massiliensis]OWF72100.1 hypothetical protein B4902_15635 [Yersinia frederiksenii]PHZ23598.1 hypothetical protein CS535_12050 [Yersinia massiliensis]
MKTTIKSTAIFCLTANNAEARQNAHGRGRLNENPNFTSTKIRLNQGQFQSYSEAYSLTRRN